MLFRLFLILFFAAMAIPCTAQQAPSPQRSVILILCDGLTFDDLHEDEYPHLTRFAETGAVGMMNCAVAGKKDSVSALLTIALGDHQTAEPGDALAANDLETVPGERGTAADAFARRTGSANQVPLSRGGLVHLGIAGLRRRGLDTATLGAALARRSTAIDAVLLGNADTTTWNRTAALLTVDSDGRGVGVVTAQREAPENRFGQIDDPLRTARMAVQSGARFVVIQMGDTTRAEALRHGLPPSEYRDLRVRALRRLDLLLYRLASELAATNGNPDILLVSPHPPSADSRRPAVWNRLTPIVASGPDFPSGLLTSATTRTPGLVANVDVAPTILSLFSAGTPATMVGRPMRCLPPADKEAKLAAVARTDFMAWLNGEALTKATVPLGAACVLLVLAALGVDRRTGGVRSWQKLCILLPLNIPAAAMLATLLPPPTVLEYGLRIGAWMLALSVAALLLSRRLRISPPVVTALLGLGLIAVDTLAGQRLLKDSVICGYALAGIRYYGIGNEYLGATLGLAIAGGFSFLDDFSVPLDGEHRRQWLPWVVAATWLFLLVLLGWPGWGANAGSLAATGAGFGVGIALLRGKKPTPALAALCIAGGLTLAFGFGALETVLISGGANAENTSHAGAALKAAAGGRGAVYLAQIAVRKVFMNLRLLFMPWFLFAAAGVALTLWTAGKLLGKSLATAFGKRKLLARSGPALLSAIVASLLFKDSGVVTAVFLVGTAGLFVLYYALTESQEI